MARKRTPLPNFLLGATQTLDAALEVPMRGDGKLDIQCIIDNGAGLAPTDAPIGVFKLFATADGSEWSQVAEADQYLTAINPTGNTLINKWVILEDVPGNAVKLIYVRTSGGAASRCKLRLIS